MELLGYPLEIWYTQLFIGLVNGCILVLVALGLAHQATPVLERLEQEQAVALEPAPASLDRHRPAIRKGKAFDIDGVGVRVLAEAAVRPTRNPTALVGGGGQLNAYNILAITATGGRANDIALPHHQSRRRRARAGRPESR